MGSYSNLLLGSFAQKDLKNIHDIIIEKALLSDNSKLQVFAGLGTSDIIFLPGTKDQNNTWNEIFKFIKEKIGIEPGVIGHLQGGWTRIYTCEISREVSCAGYNWYSAEKPDFAYMLLIRPNKPQQFKTDYFLNTIERSAPKDSIKIHNIWETDGYYSFCMLISSKKRNYSCLQEWISHLRIISKGFETYTIPLVDYRWIAALQHQESTDIFDAHESIILSANVIPGQEENAKKALCKALKRSLSDEELAENFRPDISISHGIRDIIMHTNEVKVSIYRFVHYLWEARFSSDSILTTRSHVLNHVQQSCTDRNCHDCAHEKSIPTDFPIPNPMHENQIRPLRPYHLPDVINGKDWTKKMNWVRFEPKKLVDEAYSTLVDHSKFDLEKITIKIEVEKEEDTEVRRAKDDFGKLKIVFSNEVLQSDKFELIAYHELIMAYFSSVPVSSTLYHLKKATNNQLDDAGEDFIGPLAVCNKFSKTLWHFLGEPLATAIAMKVYNLSAKDYLKEVIEVHQDFGVVTKEYLHRIVIAKFLLEYSQTFANTPMGITPAPHWIPLLKKIYSDVYLELNQEFDLFKNDTEFNKALPADIAEIFLSEWAYHKLDKTTAELKFNILSDVWKSSILFFIFLSNTMTKKELRFSPIGSEKFSSLISNSGFFKAIINRSTSYQLWLEHLGKIYLENKDDLFQCPTELQHISNAIYYNDTLLTIEQSIGETNNFQTLWISDKNIKTAWQNFSYKSIIDFGEISVNLRFQPWRQKNELGSLIPNFKFDQLFQIKLKNGKSKDDYETIASGGEFLISAEVDTSSKVSNNHQNSIKVNKERLAGKKQHLNYPSLLELYVGKGPSDLKTYTPLQFIRRMLFENQCIDWLTYHIDIQFDLDFSEKLISFNIVPEMVSMDINPWFEEFAAEYEKRIIKLCNLITSRGGIPVIEIIEGSLPKESTARIWQILSNINSQTGRIKIAIDDQFGEGTDIHRLENAITNIYKNLKAEAIELIVKIDHSAVFSVLKVMEYEENEQILDQLSFAPILSNFVSMTENALPISNGGNSTHTPLHIIFEGYGGDYSWKKSRKHLPGKYAKKMEKGIISALIKNKDVILSTKIEHVHLQGKN